MSIGNIISPIKIILLNHFFYDIWERKELNNILKINSGRDYKQLNSGSIPVYGTGGYMLSVNDKLSDTDAVGIGRKGTIDKPLYLKAPFWTVDTLFYCTSKENSDVKFIYLLFQIINWKRYDESTGVPSLSKNTISNIKTYVPKIKEQDYISKLFFSLDNTLQLHERKYEELTLIKKALLQKLFPKKDGFKPEVRYKNFNDAWEQRKLGEVVERFDNLRIPVTSSKREKGITPYYGANGIQDYVQGYTHDGEFVLVAEDGANDLQNYPVHYVNGKVWVNNHAHVLQGKNKMVDNLFLVNAIKQIKIETYLVGGSRAKLNADVMMKLPIKVPTFNEQQRLGKYFARLDSLITLHQCKLEKLKQLKKFLLQNMFI